MMADEVLQQGVRGITDLMVMPGLINLDFADVRSVMGEMGKAMMGTGEAARRQSRDRGGREGDRQSASRRRVDAAAPRASSSRSRAARTCA